MRSRNILVPAVAALAVLTSDAQAGGFFRSSADIDILFEEGTAATRDSVTFVDPNKVYDKKPGIPGVTTGSLDGKTFSDSFFVPSLAAKYSPSESFACAATYTQSFGAASDNRGIMDSSGKVRESFTTDEYGLTCAAFVDAGPGRIAFIGGLFYEEFDYDLAAYTAGPTGLTPLSVGLSDHDLGWRAGVAYDIPEIAFRSSLLYRSGTEYSATGDAELDELGMTSEAFGWGRLPQSVELNLQSGIAPDWLAFGSVKWTDWSTMDRLHLNFFGADSYNDYYWKDNWTVTGGVGHKFDDTFSGFASLTWDSGVSTGWDLIGDSVTLAAGVTAKDRFGGELQLTGAAIFNEAVEETEYGALSASTKDSVGYAVQAQYKIKF